MPPVDEQTIEFLKENISEIKSDIKNIYVELENKVSFKVFSWVLGILMVIVMGSLGLIYNKLDDASTKISDTKEQVTLIKYRLDSAEITQ